jgi:hypothetical protein
MFAIHFVHTLPIDSYIQIHIHSLQLHSPKGCFTLFFNFILLNKWSPFPKDFSILIFIIILEPSPFYKCVSLLKPNTSSMFVLFLWLFQFSHLFILSSSLRYWWEHICLVMTYLYHFLWQTDLRDNSFLSKIRIKVVILNHPWKIFVFHLTFSQLYSFL